MLCSSEAVIAAGSSGVKTTKTDEEAKMEQALASAIVTTCADVHWDDVAGLDHAKYMLQESVILPVKYEDEG